MKLSPPFKDEGEVVAACRDAQLIRSQNAMPS